MVGLYINHPSTPSGVALVPGRGLWVCDREVVAGSGAGLRGAAGLLVPAVAAWGADASGVLRQFWPGAPVINSFQISVSSLNVQDWKTRNVGWNVAGADSVTVTAYVGSGSPVTLYSGVPGYFLEWNWFNAGSQFQPGSTIVYTLVAHNASGDTTQVVSAVAPTIPAPTAAPTASSLAYNSVHLDWSLPAAGVFGTPQDYVLSWTGASSGSVIVAGTAYTIGLSASHTWTFKVAARFRATYSGAPLLTGPTGPGRVVTTPAPPETGPANGTYTMEPTSASCTYQWGAGQPAGWRSTSDGWYHGDGSSYGSSRGQQAAFFFYTRPSAWSGGLGTKTVSRVQIYLLRGSGVGASGAQTCRWNLHAYATRPSGAPAITATVDAGALAIGAGAWIDLPVSWGAAIVNATSRGVAWGRVAGRYMYSADNPTAGTPNGTLRVTIAN